MFYVHKGEHYIKRLLRQEIYCLYVRKNLYSVQIPLKRLHKYKQVKIVHIAQNGYVWAKEWRREYHLFEWKRYYHGVE